MSIFGSSDKKTYERYSENVVRPLFSAARDENSAARPGFLVGKLAEAVADADLATSAEYCKRKWGGSGDLVNIYASTCLFVPACDVLETARILYRDPVFPRIASVNYPIVARECFVPLAEKCPVPDKPSLFTILEDGGVLSRALPEGTGYAAAKFFKEISLGRDDESALVRLRASTAWNAMDHRDTNFVEHLDDQDSRLLRALS